MSIIILVSAFVVIATIVAFIIISKGTPEPTVASMLRNTDGTKDAGR